MQSVLLITKDNLPTLDCLPKLIMQSVSVALYCQSMLRKVFIDCYIV